MKVDWLMLHVDPKDLLQQEAKIQMVKRMIK